MISFGVFLPINEEAKACVTIEVKVVTDLQL